MSVLEASQLDKEARQLVAAYSEARLKAGLAFAKRLHEIENEKLYLKLDSAAYPNFARYVESCGISYVAARELISLYQAYVLGAGFSVEELSGAKLHRLKHVRPFLFKKSGNNYRPTKSKEEIEKWISNAASDLSNDDFRQALEDEKAGPHEHDWQEYRFKKCKICKIKSI